MPRGKFAETILFFLPLLLFCQACGQAGAERERDNYRAANRELSNDTLPNWATAAERRIQRLAPPPSRWLDRTPPDDGFRLPAEYEATRAVVMTWAGFTSMLEEIAVHTADAGAEVWMVDGPYSLPGVPADKYEMLDFDYNTVWARDYGPFGVHEVSSELGIIDTTYRHYAARPEDDAIPCQVAGFAGADCYTTSLILDGGNLMTDGQGNLFMSTRTYDWNDHLSQAEVDQLLKDYFAVDTIHALAYAEEYGWPADGTGHIDMFAKLLGPCKVLVAETNGDPYQAAVDAAADYFANLECTPGQNYEVWRIPGWEEYGTWYTYTNSLIVNQTVIIPSYSGADNQGARQVYEDALPAYTVVMVDSDASITSGGSVHCITREIPALAAECQTAADCDLPGVDVHACTGGTCQIISCDAGLADCNDERLDGCETALGGDEHCSACFDDCGQAFDNASGTCQEFSCVMGACEQGYLNCDLQDGNGCEAELGSPQHCTGCYDDCNDDFDNAYGTCQAGTCVMGNCHNGFGDCDSASGNGCETSLGSNEHCSGCFDDCRDDYDNAEGLCVDGACTMGACSIAYADCDSSSANGCETALGSDEHCSACFDDCSTKFEHADGNCVDGACFMGDCVQGYADCDASAANGCETPLGSDTDCGGCGDDCRDDFENASGECVDDSCTMVACMGDYADCNLDPADGCETPLGTDKDCSECGDDCTERWAHSDGRCYESSCVKDECHTGWDDCNFQMSDGCETQIGTDSDCSACGDDCTDDYPNASGYCSDGHCSLGECDEGYADCDNRDSNGCETALHTDDNCASCGDSCDDQASCIDDGGGFSCVYDACPDSDGDGFLDQACGGSDCNDQAIDINPSAQEICDSVDNDCDGLTDEDDVCKDEESGGCACGNRGRGKTGAGWLFFLALVGLAFLRSMREDI